MLEAIRHDGQEQLAASSHLTAVCARHRDHCHRLAARAEQEWLGPNEYAWFPGCGASPRTCPGEIPG
ncbi:hypothetical protein [Kibdelosporangium aridum]|uniref:hypothetical protein n=1 Tax=Kibdelosporangium aridum TaxID=2030 RepID=UPI0035E51A65